MWKERVCIVGAGLMGGSLALALRPFLTHLTLVDTNPATLTAVQTVADVATADLAAGAQSADLIILATPVRAILRLLADLPHLRPDGCLVLDLGSTKAAICRAMAGLPPPFQAIGGHPMCGRETAGFAAATPDLYRGQTFVLCRHGRTTAHVEQMALAVIEAIGARPLFLTADTHDELIAAVSHLPYVVAAALMRTAVEARAWSVSATGFHDTTRLAGSDPQMMLDILLTNRTAVLHQIGEFQKQLGDLKRCLLQNDEAGLVQWLLEAQRQHVRYRAQKIDH
jgi:prephenate dehydrogenase